MKKTKTKKDDEKIIDQILEKIKKGEQKKEAEESEAEKKKENKQVPCAKRLAELRAKKEEAEKSAELSRTKEESAQALVFFNTMSEEEERVFNQMMDIFSAETEKQRIENLANFIKKEEIPERLLLNLQYFPHLQKYYLSAKSKLKNPKRKKDKKMKKEKNPRSKMKKEDKRKAKKRLEKIIAREFYVDVADASQEEKRAIESLLRVSERFRELYEKYKKLQ